MSGGARVVGRDAELRTVLEFLESADGGVLLLEGEPGIGKTTVWRAGVEAAANTQTVLSCRPTEAESDLSFAGLGDLLGGVPSALVDGLPPPLRHALRVALLEDDPTGRAPDPRAVGMAIVGILSALLESLPVLIAIDDVQWLDPPSAAALAFATRRIEHTELRLLLARRTGTPHAAEPLPVERERRVALGGLSLASIHHVITRELGEAPPRPVLLRIEQASRGNPYFALELARAHRDSNASLGAPLAVPESVRDLVSRRVNALSAGAREAALYVSAAAAPGRGLVRRLLGEKASEALEEAERKGVLEVQEGRLRFTHPLLASAVYGEAPAEERRRLHYRLAELVEGVEERARHLALAADVPSVEVAEALESAAREAVARGAPSAAAELMELCCTLTPVTDQTLAQRRLELADLQLTCGNTTLAQELAEGLVGTLPPGALRARACELLAELLHVTGGAARAAELCESALAEAGDDRELRARIHVTLALVSYDDFGRAQKHAQAACDILDGLERPDPALHSQALMAVMSARHSVDGRIDLGLAARALELERLAPAPHVADRVAAYLGAWFKYAGDFEQARRWLDETRRAALDEGDDGSLPFALSHYPQLELWEGNWDRAAAAAEEHLALAEQTGQPGQRAQALFNVGLVAAHRGEVDRAREAIQEALAFGEAHDEAYTIATTLSVLGFLELSLGDAEAAVRALERSSALFERIGSSEPRRPAADYVESLVATGDLPTARRALAGFDDRARRYRNVAMLAHAARCRALLLAAEGDLDGALDAVDEALRHHESVRIPFDVGQTRLVLGRIRRRRREKRLAREALGEALGLFEGLGAPLWAERTRDELARVGLRRTDGDELTPTERRIAELAANGLTNREVAKAAFVSPKTVEANLARVYRKLGISSRAELGARMASAGKAESPQT